MAGLGVAGLKLRRPTPNGLWEKCKKIATFENVGNFLKKMMLFKDFLEILKMLGNFENLEFLKFLGKVILPEMASGED